jgi:hypothetical protein
MKANLFRIALLAVAVIALSAPPAFAVTVASNLQGWVNSAGTGIAGGNGSNTFTGNEGGNRFNSWANFDLTGVTGPIGTAVLEIYSEIYPAGGPSYLTGVYDVSTSLASLTSTSSGVAGYTDLGSGHQYGSATLAHAATQFVTLSAQAVADINAALGGTFRVGFTNITLNAVDPSGDGVGVYTHGNSLGNQNDPSTWVPGHPRLILTPAAVPLPPALVLTLIGGVIGGVALRRRGSVID